MIKELKKQLPDMSAHLQVLDSVSDPRNAGKATRMVYSQAEAAVRGLRAFLDFVQALPDDKAAPKKV